MAESRGTKSEKLAVEEHPKNKKRAGPLSKETGETVTKPAGKAVKQVKQSKYSSLMELFGDTWEHWPLKLTFTTALCGGKPKSKDILPAWLESQKATDPAYKKMQETELPAPRTIEEITEEHKATMGKLDEDADKALEKSSVGFSEDDTGLFIPAYHVRAHLKDCAGVVGETLKNAGAPFTILQFRSKMVARLYVDGDRLYLRNADGDIIKERTGYRDATMNVLTAQGPRTCLKRVDYVDGAVLECVLLFHRGAGMLMDHIRGCLIYGATHGLGQDRSLQFGRYTFKIGEQLTD